MSSHEHRNDCKTTTTPSDTPVAVTSPPDRSARDKRSLLVQRPSLRAWLFGLLCAACFLVAGGYVGLAAQRTELAAKRASAEPASSPETLALRSGQPHLLFLQTGGDDYRRVALVPLEAPDGPRYLTDLQCQRVYFAAGQGLCLGHDYYTGLDSSYETHTFDRDFRPQHTFTSSGIPSRARLSPDGRYGATTVFVTGHSYAEAGFSTLTTLLDIHSGTMLGDLEQFTVWRDGARLEAIDFNFWGVTFAHDGNRFYATLASFGKTYLIEGDLAARQARILRENAECPSLSPDNTRLVFKKRLGGSLVSGPVRWQLYVLDLATMVESPLSAETRSVDDQIEWLDDRQILYALPDEGPPATIRPDIWVLPVDGSGSPRMLLSGAMSPVVVRGTS